MDIDADSEIANLHNTPENTTSNRFRAIKNTLIGNPTAKAQLAISDPSTVRVVVHAINFPNDEDGLSSEKCQIEAAHLLASLTYGTPEVVVVLLEAGAAEALLNALANCTRDHLTASSPTPLVAALARSVKCVVAAAARIVGPHDPMLGPPPLKAGDALAAKNILDHIFQEDALDILLPLLEISGSVQLAIAGLLGSSLRSESHRSRVASWTPPHERSSETTKVKRGWERADSTSGTHNVGWVARSLLRSTKCDNTRTRETTLESLAALVRGQPALALALCFSSHDDGGQTPVSLVLMFCKSRDTGVKLAACQCLVDILKAARLSHGPISHSKQISDPPYTLIGVINGMISDSSQRAEDRARACVSLYHLVADDHDLEHIAFVSGSIRSISSLLSGLIPDPNTPWAEDEEPHFKSLLLEASLICVAALTMHVEDNRAAFLSEPPALLPIVSRSLTHPEPGVRYAACQCVRALSRSVSVLRTAIGDSKLPSLLLDIIKNDQDNRVILIALMGIANMVNDFAPTREVLIRSGVVSKLSEFVKYGDEELKTNSIWAIRNALYHSDPSDTGRIMDVLGWDVFSSLLVHSKPRIREISSAALTNMMASGKGMELVHQSIPGLVQLFEKMVQPAFDEVTTINALKAVSNFATHRQSEILAQPALLRCIRDSLLHPSVNTRKTALHCVHHLVNQRTSHKEIREAEIDAALRGLVQNRILSPASPSPAGGSSLFTSPFSPGLPDIDSKDTRQIAKEALKWIEMSSK